MRFYEQRKFVINYRKKHNLTQKQMASILGYETAQFVSNLERGLCGLPISAAKKIIQKSPRERMSLIKAITNDCLLHVTETLRR